MKQQVVIILILLLILKTWAQEPVYFNNIYNPENTYASGRAILQIGNYYYGIAGTESLSSYGIRLGLFKISSSGNLLNWNTIGENNQHYYPGSVGGTLIRTNDGNLAFACQVEDPSTVYSSLIKVNLNLDTIWKKDYYTENDWTMTIKVKQTIDGGYIMVGQVDPGVGYYYDVLLLKTDSAGNELWHQTYGGNWAEQGTDVIQTPDSGYLIGGFFWQPGYNHSLDAMVLKTDSLGNEEWTQYYGNPDVDDDMALVAMADDGNFLVAMVYGDKIYSPMVRSGRFNILKLDNEGNTIFNSIIGNKRISFQIKNFRKLNNGFVASGFSYETDSVTFQYYSGWMMKLDNNLDSVWYHDYIHEDENWENFLYDASPTSDNGYIAIGKARPDQGGSTNKMWIIKVDSMGCDTPGCFTTVVPEFSPSGGGQGEVLIWPNPAKGQVTLSLSSIGMPLAEVCEAKTRKAKYIRIYNSQGLKVKEITIPENIESVQIDISKHNAGLFYLQYLQNGQVTATAKFIKR